MKLVLSLFLWFTFLLLPTTVYANQVPMELTAWHVLENGIFDNPSVSCLERDGPSQWEEREGGLGILIHESLPCQTVITPMSEEYYGLRRFSLVFTMKIDDAAHDHNILVLWKDRDNFSDFHLVGQNIEYEKIVNGQPVFSVSSRLQLGPQSTHRYRVEHDESTGVTKLWRDGLPIFTVIEPEDTPQLPSAWVGFRASVGAQRTSDVTFSDFAVENLGQTYSTTTSRIKQDDPRWAHLEYDSAIKWSTDKPTIARWGCALTSAIMVLQSYGITHLPSGQPLLPDTVNAWLLTQPDGYFGEGHLNWRALTRLALEIHKLHGTTKLEFTYELPDNKLGWLTETLALGKPVILDLEGHFVVAHEAGEGEKDFLIHDPLFPFFTLKEYRNTFLSARLFTPSQTDLSAITIVAPLHASLSFTTADGEELDVTKVLLPPLEKNAHEPLQLHDIPKPPHEHIFIRVQSTHPSSIPLTFFSYATEGAVTTKNVTVTTSSQEGEVLESHWSIDSQTQTILSLPNNSSDHTQLMPNKTPFFIPLLEQWKAELQDFSSLEVAHNWLSSVHWILETSWSNAWLSHSEKQVLLLELQRALNEKFP